MNVQVLLSTYNGKRFVEEQVESIINQVDVDVTLLIRDDGSKDGTQNILKTLEEKYPNQIKVLFAENKGVTQSFFELLEMSSEDATYYAFADQDDVWAPNKLKTACFHITDRAKANQPFLYVGNYTPVNEKLEVIEAANSINRDVNYGVTIVENIALGCTMVMNRLLRDAIVREVMPPALIHDWYIYLLAQTIGAVYVDDEPTMFYRQHENNVIGNRNQGIKENVKKMRALFEWARENKQQLQFIEQHYHNQANAEALTILSEYAHISNQSLRKRIAYNKRRAVRRTSAFHDKALSLLILMKKA